MSQPSQPLTSRLGFPERENTPTSVSGVVLFGCTGITLWETFLRINARPVSEYNGKCINGGQSPHQRTPNP